jgi:uncharacterized membrane protein YfcA
VDQRGRELIAGGVLVLLTGGGWAQTATLSAGARMFPRLVLGLLGLLSVAYLLRTLVRRWPEGAAGPFFTHPGRFAVALGLMAGFGAGFTQVGFVTAALMFVPAFAVALGLRRPLLLAAGTASFVAFVHLVFVVGLRRPLPPDLLLGLLTG